MNAQPRTQIRIPRHVAEQAANHATVLGPNDCWLSNKAAGSNNGYPLYTWTDETGKSRTATVARAAYVYYSNAQIPLDNNGNTMTVDHTCHVRACVNPNHLRLLTNEENARDGRLRPNNPAPKPLGRLCRKGHELLLWATGSIQCRECKSARNARNYARRMARRAQQS